MARLKTTWPKEGAISDEDVEKLATLDFFPFDHSEDHLLLCLEHIFEQMVSSRLEGLSKDALRNFLLVVRANYTPTVPFHNFFHAFAVTQHCFALLKMTGISRHFESVELLSLFIACIGHDVGHPGLNNTYQKNAVTPLALRYNDVSVLENFHCACTCDILNNPECNILVSRGELKKRVRELVIPLILTTDVSLHKKWTSEMQAIHTNIDWADSDHRLIVLRNFVMMSDLNNESRSFRHSKAWGPRVQEEFYRQGDLEKQKGLHVLPMMERTAKVEKEQQGFIKFLCLHLYEANAVAFPELKLCVDNLNKNMSLWASQ